MADEDFDLRLDHVERAIKVINTIENNPDLQAAAFSHLFGTAPSLRGDSHEEPAETQELASDEGDGGDQKPPATTTGKRVRRAPAAVSQDKTLQIAPAGKVSWAEFSGEKKPGTMNDKYAVCVHWLLDVADLPKATIHQIVSLFIAAKWTLPNNPRNQASQAGRAGYLDSSDQQDIKLTSLGSARVLNELPPK